MSVSGRPATSRGNSRVKRPRNTSVRRHTATKVTAALSLVTASTVGGVAVQSRTALAVYCNFTGYPYYDYPSAPTRATMWTYMAPAAGERYNNSTPRACWIDDNNPNDANEGVDCSGLLGKAWALRADYGASNLFRGWNHTYEMPVISTRYMYGYTAASFGNVDFKNRANMDAGVAAYNDGVWHGHVFLIITPSSDGSNDYVFDAASATSNPQVGYRYKDVTTGYYGYTWEWKRRTGWSG